MRKFALAPLPTIGAATGLHTSRRQLIERGRPVARMRAFFTLAFLAVLILCTLLAARAWYANRGRQVEPAERQVLLRFVAGLAIFWLVAIAGYLGGFISF